LELRLTGPDNCKCGFLRGGHNIFNVGPAAMRKKRNCTAAAAHLPVRACVAKLREQGQGWLHFSPVLRNMRVLSRRDRADSTRTLIADADRPWL